MLFFSYKVKGEYTKLYYMTVKAHFNQQLNDRCVNLTSVIALNWYVSIICLLFLCYAKSPTTEIPAGRNSMDACVPIFSFFYQLPLLSLIIRHSMFTISTSNSWSYSCQSLHCRAAHLLLAWFHSTFHNTDTKKCYFYPWTSHSPGSEKKMSFYLVKVCICAESLPKAASKRSLFSSFYQHVARNQYVIWKGCVLASAFGDEQDLASCTLKWSKSISVLEKEKGNLWTGW